MSSRDYFKVVLGCFIGIAFGAAMVYGVLELADLIMEWSDELSRAA